MFFIAMAGAVALGILVAAAVLFGVACLIYPLVIDR